jgi:lipopolysaccharide/colanic/teichoic acid biosynthesis glycosyltransferase
VSIADAALVVASPFIALYLREPPIAPPDGLHPIALYCGLSIVFSLLAVIGFRLNYGIKHHFSALDVTGIIKAVMCADLMTFVTLFAINRVDGISRSTLFIHAIVLLTALILARVVVSWYKGGQNKIAPDATQPVSEHIVLIGSNYHLLSLFIELIAAQWPTERKIVAVLDERREDIGRAIAGVPILGSAEDLSPIIDELAVHGVWIDRVIVAGDKDLLSGPVLEKVTQVCEQRDIEFGLMTEMIGSSKARVRAPNELEKEQVTTPAIRVPRYFAVKRPLDFIAASGAIILLLPLMVCVSGLVLLDVGSPVLFWQRRLGRDSRPFMIYKFRTMRPPFDRRGRFVPEQQQESSIGRLLRRTGLDELPQLLNVMLGDMSLIGPRPLLPLDQPDNPTVRLLVRPGITGWAQVNGAKRLTATEKVRLDEWYICNASLSMDLRIALLTVRYLVGADAPTSDNVVPRSERRENPRIIYSNSEIPVYRVARLVMANTGWSVQSGRRRLQRKEDFAPSRDGVTLFYLVDWLPPDFGAVGQYGMIFAREIAESGRRVCLIGLTTKSSQTSLEHVAGSGAFEVRRIRAGRYDKSRYVTRMLWTLRTNMRLIWEVMRQPASRRAEILFTGAPPFMLFFAVVAKWVRGARLIYRITDFYPEVIVAQLGKRPLVLALLERVTWHIRKRVDAFEVLGEDQRQLLLNGGIPPDRIRLKRDVSPVSNSGNERPAAPPAALSSHRVLLYSGNYGVAHEVGTVVDGLIRHHREGSGRFGLWLNGSGSRLSEVAQSLQRAGVPVALTVPVPIEQLPALLTAANVHLITLRPAFSGIVLPSKIYGCIASRRPILFVGPRSSDVHLLCKDMEPGTYEQVDPGDVNGVCAALERLGCPKD